MSYIYYGWGKWWLAPKGTLQDLCKIWYWRPSKKWVRPDTGLTQESFFYLPSAVIGEDLVTSEVQLVPLQQKLQLPIPVILILFIGAKGCRRTGEKSNSAEKRVGTIPWPLVRQILSTFPSNQTFRTVILPTLLHIVYFTHSCPYSACPKAYNEDQLKP